MLASLRIGLECGLMSRFPRSNLGPSLIEETREVSLAHLLACFWSKQIPQRPIHVEDLQIALLAWGATSSVPNKKRSGKRLIKSAVIFVASGLATTYLATSSHEISK